MSYDNSGIVASEEQAQAIETILKKKQIPYSSSNIPDTSDNASVDVNYTASTGVDVGVGEETVVPNPRIPSRAAKFLLGKRKPSPVGSSLVSKYKSMMGPKTSAINITAPLVKRLQPVQQRISGMVSRLPQPVRQAGQVSGQMSLDQASRMGMTAQDYQLAYQQAINAGYSPEMIQQALGGLVPDRAGHPVANGYTPRSSLYERQLRGEIKGYMVMPSVKRPPVWHGRGIDIFRDGAREQKQNIFKQSRNRPTFKPHIVGRRGIY